MLLSMKWLNEYVDVRDIAIKDFCNAMTMAGSKVESYYLESEEIDNVVVGKIVSISKHENADRLLVCKVDIGEENLLQIVTAATNIFEGAIVPVALNKSHISGRREIKKGKLRGVLSEGMFCSLKELNLTVNDFPDAIEDGILIINSECKIGQDIKTVLGIDDIIVDFEITPNRADCLSVIGLAREVSAVFDRPFLCYSNEDIDNKLIDNKLIKVDIQNKEICKRYMVKIINNVKIAPSPQWLRERLRSSGIKPINNVVDITNYVMLKYGQPLHAFDYDKISDHQIIIRNAVKGETIKLLDGSKKELDESILVVADKDKPLSVAGIMGGENSGVSDQTKSVVFEIANFDQNTIRKTSNELSIRSESSSRFEKGIDVSFMPIIMNEVCKLVLDLNIGDIEEGIIDINNCQEKVVNIPLNYDFINKCLGLNLSQLEIRNILSKLSIKVEGDVAIIPSWRLDLEGEADIVEEVARIYGYDKIMPKKSNLSINALALRSDKQNFYNSVLDFMASQGYNEINTFSFISPQYYDKINLEINDKLRNSVKILNPLGEDTSVMRTTAIPSMLEVISRNYNNQNLDGKFFEIAKEYLPNMADTLPLEKDKIMIGLYGKRYNFYDLKFVIENLFDWLNIKNYNFISQDNNKTFHPGRCADIFICNEKIGVVGQIHPQVVDNYQTISNIFLSNLDINKMLLNSVSDRKYNQISKFPSVTRDLSLICDKDLPVIIVEDLIKQTIGNYLEEIELIDVYEGYQLDDINKSVCYSLKLRSFDKTLTDEDIDIIINSVLEKLKTIDVAIRKF